MHASTHQRSCHEQITWLWLGWSQKQKTQLHLISVAGQTACQQCVVSPKINMNRSLGTAGMEYVCCFSSKLQTNLYTSKYKCVDPILPTVSRRVILGKNKFTYSYLFLPYTKVTYQKILHVTAQSNYSILWSAVSNHVITYTIYQSNDIRVWWYRISLLMMIIVSSSNA